MFSGKSTELARRIRRHKVANRQCLVVKYAGDTRYESEPAAAAGGADASPTLKGCVITHDRQALTAFPARTLAEVDNVVHAFDVVGIDEGQFFPDVVERCERWAATGKTVIVAALDSTFQRKPFNDILGLVPLAENVTKLSAVCAHCRGDASFTKRVGTRDETMELIGGADMYVATCRACHDLDLPATPARADSATAAAAAVGPTAASIAGATPTRPPSSASSAERARARKRASSASEGTPAASGFGFDLGVGSGAKHENATTPTLANVGEKMRALTVDSPSTPAAFGAFGSPVAGGSASAAGGTARKKAAGLGAAAKAAAMEVMGGNGKRLARGAGGPGRSPMMDLSSRGMGAVARSPLASLR